MRARLNAPQMRERHDQANRAVTAHAQITDVVEKNHARHAIGCERRHKQRAHHHIRTARFIHHRRTKVIELVFEALHPLGQAARA